MRGAEGSVARSDTVPEAGMDVIKVPTMTQDERWNIYGSWFKVNGSILTLTEIEAGGKEYLRTDG